MSPGSLRTSVSRLRKLLGSEVLRTDAAGYRLEADVDSEPTASRRTASRRWAKPSTGPTGY